MVGITVCECLLGRHPFEGENINATFKNIIENKIVLEEEGLPEISDDAKDFIRKLTEKDPKERIYLEKALRHPWLAVKHRQDLVYLMLR